MDALTGSSYLLAYDIFHATLLFNGFAIVVAFLPAFTLIYLVYRVVTSFVMVALTDRHFTKWGVSVLFVMLVVHFFLGGIYSLGSDGKLHDVLLKPKKPAVAGAEGQSIDRLILYMSNGFENAVKTNPSFAPTVTVPTYGALPFEMYAFMDNALPEVLADTSSMNLAAMNADGMKSVGTNARVSLYLLTRSDLVKDSGISKSWSALNSRLEDAPVLSDVVLYTQNSLMTMMYSVAHLSGSYAVERTARDKDAEFKKRGLTNAAPDEVRMAPLRGDLTAEWSRSLVNARDMVEIPFTTESDDHFVSGGTIHVDEFNLNTDYANVALLLPVYMRYCQSSNEDADNPRPRTVSGMTSTVDTLNPCHTTSKNYVTASISDDAWSLPCVTIAGFSLGACSNLSSLSEPFDVATTPVTTSCRDIESYTDLDTAYSEYLSSAPGLSSQICLALGRDITRSYLGMLENAGEIIDKVDSVWEPQMTHYAHTDAANLTAELGQENLASLGSAMRSLLQPFAARFDQKDYKIKSAAVTDDVVDRTVKEKKGFLSSKIGLFAVLVGLGKIGTSIISTIACLVASASIPVVMAYTIVYYSVIFSTSVATVMFPVWIVILGGKVIAQSGDAGEQRNSFVMPSMQKFFGYLFLVGISLIALALIHGLVQYVITANISTIFRGVVGNLLTTGGASARSPELAASGLQMFGKAFKSTGLIIGIMLIPALLARLVHGDRYMPENRAARRMGSELVQNSGIAESGRKASMVMAQAARSMMKTKSAKKK